MQNDYMAGIEELDPARNAKASVSDVIVIEGPACLIHSISLSVIGFLREL